MTWFDKLVEYQKDIFPTHQQKLQQYYEQGRNCTRNLRYTELFNKEEIVKYIEQCGGTEYVNEFKRGMMDEFYQITSRNQNE